MMPDEQKEQLPTHKVSIQQKHFAGGYTESSVEVADVRELKQILNARGASILSLEYLTSWDEEGVEAKDIPVENLSERHFQWLIESDRHKIRSVSYRPSKSS